MVIRSYSKFISESRSESRWRNLDISQYKKELSMLENEYLRMQYEGLTERQINENIFTSFFSSLGGGFTDTFKNYVVDWAAQKLGINPMDENGQPSFFYQVVRNVIESVKFTDLGSYFGKGSCKFWTKAIIEGLIETLEERGIQYLLPRLGMNIDMSTGMGGTIASGLREALTNAANNTAFINSIEKMIGDKICGFKLGDVISGASTSDKTKIQSQIETAGEKNPDIYTQAMKSGLSSVLQFNK
ncbi:MAG: hypothetical protein EBS19_01480 [Spirochaetia bacterium]|nr:hypothetical protein [Spirochaetia bacterium]